MRDKNIPLLKSSATHRKWSICHFTFRVGLLPSLTSRTIVRVTSSSLKPSKRDWLRCEFDSHMVSWSFELYCFLLAYRLFSVCFLLMQSCFSNLCFHSLCLAVQLLHFVAGEAALSCLRLITRRSHGLLFSFSLSLLLFFFNAARINSTWQVQCSERICFLKSLFCCFVFPVWMSVEFFNRGRSMLEASQSWGAQVVRLAERSQRFWQTQNYAQKKRRSAKSSRSESIVSFFCRSTCNKGTIYWMFTETIVIPLVVLQSFFQYVLLLCHIVFKNVRKTQL